MERNEQDELLWRQAAKRAGFQRNLVMYLIFNAFFWAIWWFTTDNIRSGIPWPVWAALGWGIGLVFQYMSAYGGSRTDLTRREYERLKNQQNN